MSSSWADGGLRWVRALARVNRVPVQWDRVALSAVGIAAPVGLSLLLYPGDSSVIGAGALASMGALVATVMDLGSAGIERVHRMLLGSLLATVGFALGTLVYGHSVMTFVIVVAAAAVSGLSGAISTTASKSGLYFLTFTVMAANADFGLASPLAAPLFFLAGAMWRLSLTVVVAGLVGRTLSPERRAVADVYTAIANQLAGSAGSAPRPAAATLTTKLDEAYDLMVAARTRVVDRDTRWQSLVMILNGAGPVVTASIAVAGEGRPVDARVVVFLRAVAAWLADSRQSLPPLPPPDASSPQRAALAAAVAHVARVVTQLSPKGSRRGHVRPDLALVAQTSIAERLRASGSSLRAGGEMRSAVVRLVLCMAVAQAICLVLNLDRPYLVMLTVAQVMKPDFGSVFARAVQRAFGTVIGVVIGSLVIVLLPHGVWQVLVIAVLAASIPITKARNYGLYLVVTTPLSVVLVEVHAGSTSALIGSRLMDTLLGCAIVILLGYLLWPSTWRAPRRIAVTVAELARSIALYSEIALGQPRSSQAGGEARDTTQPGGAVSDGELRLIAARRDTSRRLADLRTRVTQSLAEPPRVSSATASWMPEIEALQCVADAVTAAQAIAAVAECEIDMRDVDSSRDALIDLAGAIALDRSPGAEAVPSSGPLEALGAEISSARSALAFRARSPKMARTPS